MQYLSKTRRIARALKPFPLLEADVRFVSHASHALDSTSSPNNRSPPASVFPGMVTCSQLYNQSATVGSMMLRSNFSSEAKHVENPTGLLNFSVMLSFGNGS
ncbi:unnamed protein product [Microthlaspi erraticum]|uniref:Uncharacterized protein n=1 Tax=Microthlaspi erraticum TaxID=1685480 RepID=A0A6D2JKQ2_9BRAS|nr:unnamed protein product [Microthlaspi erraticum]CAA7037171.1 unnamed protein product [Microthlaspi erraticum]